jgi:hypothetical protein
VRGHWCEHVATVIWAGWIQWTVTSSYTLAGDVIVSVGRENE